MNLFLQGHDSSNGIDFSWVKMAIVVQRLFLILIAAILGVYLYFNFAQLEFFSIYFLALTVVSILVLFFYMQRLNIIRDDNINELLVYFNVACVFIFFTVIKIFFNSWVPCREDELFQFIVARDKNPVMSAFEQQQPPLSYVFSAAGEIFFGTSQLGVRFFTHITSSFLLVMFFCILKMFRLNTLRACAATILFFFTPFIFIYSIEARPYSLALLIACFFIFEVFLSFDVLINRFQSACRICAAALLLLMSLGFQPPIFVITVILMAILGAVFKKCWRAKWMAIFYGAGCALLLFLPVQYKIFSFSKTYLQISELSDKLLNSMQNFIWLPIFYNFNFLAIVIMSVLISVYFLLKSNKYKNLGTGRLQMKEYLPIGLTLLLASTFFIFVAVFVFAHSIKWDFKERYILLGILVFVMGFVLVLSFFVDRFTTIAIREYRVNPADGLFILITMSILYGLVIRPHWAYRRKYEKSSVEVVLNQAKPTDLFVPLCERPAGCWDYFLELDFYLGGRSQQQSENLLVPYTNFLNKMNNMQEADVLFVHLEYPPEMDLKEEIEGIVILQKYDRTYLLKIEGRNKVGRLQKLLSEIEKKLPTRRKIQYESTYVISRAIQAIKSGDENFDLKIQTWEDAQIAKYFRTHALKN